MCNTLNNSMCNTSQNHNVHTLFNCAVNVCRCVVCCVSYIYIAKLSMQQGHTPTLTFVCVNPEFFFFLSLSLSLSLMRARTHAHTHKVFGI